MAATATAPRPRPLDLALVARLWDLTAEILLDARAAAPLTDDAAADAWALALAIHRGEAAGAVSVGEPTLARRPLLALAARACRVLLDLAADPEEVDGDLASLALDLASLAAPTPPSTTCALIALDVLVGQAVSAALTEAPEALYGAARAALGQTLLTLDALASE